MVKSSGSVVGCGGTGREKKGLTCGAHMSVIEEEKRCNNGIRKPTCANAFRASWAEQGGIIPWGGGEWVDAADWASWAEL
jgi:hypothetical protein